jgi:hypothetical protein
MGTRQRGTGRGRGAAGPCHLPACHILPHWPCHACPPPCLVLSFPVLHLALKRAKRKRKPNLIEPWGFRVNMCMDPGGVPTALKSLACGPQTPQRPPLQRFHPVSSPSATPPYSRRIPQVFVREVAPGAERPVSPAAHKKKVCGKKSDTAIQACST